MAPHGPIGVGEVAPDFTLVDTHGTPVHLGDLRGSPVVLVFMPGAFTGTCTGEICALRDNLSLFEAAGVRLLVVACDSAPTLRAWAEHEGASLELLSDFWPHGAVTAGYGVFDADRGRALRGSFLIDADGVVRWSVVNVAGQARDLAGYRAALALL
ncbi:peroxiredoxin [Pengzhenrongella sicca]|uniref:Alkyl hydroperoxide reductase E n=1 Tax=Pengzhenrongella sicca TaxID=2819238 RepID=A0A8A4Z944_9MICO|nr:peroxiredoxin [Pengzhenrongella sicca]QTE28440.1 peroxiredoxin [Pengzhenrongella sicca]